MGQRLSHCFHGQALSTTPDTTRGCLLQDLQKENERLRTTLEAFMEVQVSANFRPQIGSLEPMALKVLSFWFGMDYPVVIIIWVRYLGPPGSSTS